MKTKEQIALEDIKKVLQGLNLSSAPWTQLSGKLLRIDAIVSDVLEDKNAPPCS